MRKLLLPMRQLLLTGICVGALVACQSTPVETLEQYRARILQEHGFQQTEEGWELSFADKLLFATDEYTLTNSSLQAVQKVSSALQLMGLLNLRVEGHADSTGSAAYNEQLSLLRATAVADVLAVGIPGANIAVHGHGDNQPIANNKTSSGRAENRRVAIIILAE